MAEMQVRAAQTAYDQVAHFEFAGLTQQAMNLWQATTNYEQAQAEYNRALKGATNTQIATARAQVALAQADLDALGKGPDPDALAAAEAQVEQAQAALDALLAGASARTWPQPRSTSPRRAWPWRAPNAGWTMSSCWPRHRGRWPSPRCTRRAGGRRFAHSYLARYGRSGIPHHQSERARSGADLSGANCRGHAKGLPR